MITKILEFLGLLKKKEEEPRARLLAEIEEIERKKVSKKRAKKVRKKKGEKVKKEKKAKKKAEKKEKKARKSKKEAIVEYLKRRKKPATIEEISKRVGTTYQTTRRYLYMLQKEGKVKKVNGGWKAA